MKTVNVDLLHLTKVAAMEVFRFVKEKKERLVASSQIVQILHF